MDTRYDLIFRPCDALESAEFEDALFAFVGQESEPGVAPAEAPVVARYDAPHGCWRLSFETQTLQQAFRAFWRAQTEKLDREAEAAEG